MLHKMIVCCRRKLQTATTRGKSSQDNMPESHYTDLQDTTRHSDNYKELESRDAYSLATKATRPTYVNTHLDFEKQSFISISKTTIYPGTLIG